MQTEFTCGIYTAKYADKSWALEMYPHQVGTIDADGKCLIIHNRTILPLDDLLEIAVLMNNIKRQYKQLNND